MQCRIYLYLLQIVKCNDTKCCDNFRTSWKSVFTSQFLTTPVPVRQILEEPAVPSIGDVKANYRFIDRWKRIGIQQLIPNSRFNQIHKI